MSDDIDIKALLHEYGAQQKKYSDRELLLPSGKVITFNDEQFEGLTKIKSWLKNGHTFFTLAGYAGTGKTTMIKKFLKNIMVVLLFLHRHIKQKGCDEHYG